MVLQNVKNGVVLGGKGLLKVMAIDTIRYAYDFLFSFNRNSAAILPSVL